MHRYRMRLIFRWSTNLLRGPLNAQVWVPGRILDWQASGAYSYARKSLRKSLHKSLHKAAYSSYTRTRNTRCPVFTNPFFYRQIQVSA